jgi:hypothetical protein
VCAVVRKQMQQYCRVREGLSGLERSLSLSLRKQAMTLLLQLMVTIFNEIERESE